MLDMLIRIEEKNKMLSYVIGIAIITVILVATFVAVTSIVNFSLNLVEGIAKLLWGNWWNWY